MDISDKLSKDDFDRINKAVKKAEDPIFGEIVPVILKNSYHYPSAKYKLALLLSFLGFLILIAGDRWIPNFGLYDPLYYFAIVFSLAILGFIMPVIFPFLAVFITTEKEKRHAVYQKAETIFLGKAIFNTIDRTGIMIFISFEEHQVVVMADSGINEKVDQSDWDILVADLIQDIKNKTIVVGLEKAIDRCSQILQAKGFTKTEDDTNELSDNLITDE